MSVVDIQMRADPIRCQDSGQERLSGQPAVAKYAADAYDFICMQILFRRVGSVDILEIWS